MESQINDPVKSDLVEGLTRSMKPSKLCHHDPTPTANTMQCSSLTADWCAARGRRRRRSRRLGGARVHQGVGTREREREIERDAISIGLACWLGKCSHITTLTWPETGLISARGVFCSVWLVRRCGLYSFVVQGLKSNDRDSSELKNGFFPIF